MVQGIEKGWTYLIEFVARLRFTVLGLGWGAKRFVFRRIMARYRERIIHNFVDPRHPAFSNRFSDGVRAYLCVAALGESSPAGSTIAMKAGVGGIG